jgi:putative transposase
MASTYLALHCHLVFSTKERLPLVEPSWRDRLHAYMGGILCEMDVVPESTGGTADHVHVLAGFRATHAIADIVHDVKRGSSAWVHDELKQKEFAWQTGYAALTVSPSQVKAVQQYIESQKNIITVRVSKRNTGSCWRKQGLRTTKNIFGDELLHPFRVRKT